MNSNEPWAKTIAYGLILAVIAACFYLIWKSKEQDPLLDFGIVSILSLLAIYHRQYDVFLLFPGLIYLYLFARQQPAGKGRTIWLGSLILILGLQMAPGNLVQSMIYRFPELSNNYLLRLLAPYQAWSGVFLLGLLITIKRGQMLGWVPVVRLPDGELKT